MTTARTEMMEKMKNDFERLSCDHDKISFDYDKLGEEALPLTVKHLTPSLLKEAREKLNETEDGRQRALAEFRSLIEGEKKLFCPMDDLFLTAFLRARKYDVKRAFKLFQNYWKFRKDYDKFLSAVDFEKGCALLKRNFLGLLERRGRDGCAIFVAKAGQWDPSKDHYETGFRILSAILCYCQEHEATQIAGFRAIFDLRGITWTQMKYCTPSNLLLLVRSTQFCYPARYKGVHVLCESKWVKLIWSMAYPMLSAKLKRRITFHSDDLTPLREYIHPSVLPAELGGEGPPFKNVQMLEVLCEKNNKVIDFLKYGYKD